MDEVTRSISDAGEGWYWPDDADAGFGPLRVTGVGRRIEPRGGRQFVDRTLDRLSLSLVLQGNGTFFDHGQSTPFSAGDVLILLPGIHHRYASADDTGWEAIWCFLACDQTLLADTGLRNGPLQVGLRSRCARGFRDLLRLARDPLSPRRLLAPIAFDLLCQLSLQLRPPVAPPPRDAIDLALAMLRDHPERAWDFPLLAAQHGISYSLLRQRLRQRCGMAPQRLLQSLRCDRACELLAQGMAVQAVGRAVGFDDPFHFSRVFRRHVGLSPSGFRRQVLAVNPA